jgi:hypothetical protein
MWPLLVPVGRGGASGKALPVGAAPRAGGAEGVLNPACLPSVADGRKPSLGMRTLGHVWTGAPGDRQKVDGGSPSSFERCRNATVECPDEHALTMQEHDASNCEGQRRRTDARSQRYTPATREQFLMCGTSRKPRERKCLFSKHCVPQPGSPEHGGIGDRKRKR